MRCPYCHENIQVQGRFCPKCGEQVFGLPLRREAGTDPGAAPAPPPRPSEIGSEVIDIELEESAEPTPAEAEAVGKTCPYCRFPIKAGEAVTVCPECGVPHHADCWQENGGCTTYGCRQAPRAGRAAEPVTYAAGREAFPSPAGRPMPVGAREILEAELDGQATNALIFAVLSVFCCGVLSIISLSWGISILSQVKKLGLSPSAARSKAVAAIVISGVVMLLVLVGIFVMLAGGQQ